MNKFIVISYRHRRDVAHVLRNVDLFLEKELPFHIARKHVFEFSRAGLLLVAAEAAASPFGEIDHVYIDGDQFAVIDGCPIFKGQDLSIPLAERIFRLLVRVGPANAFDALMGDYCLVARIGDRLVAYGDFAGLCPIFMYRQSRLIGISNRQRLLHRILNPGGAVTLDPEACAWLTGQANIFGRRSPYRGVRLVTPGYFVEVKRQAAQLERHTPFYVGQRSPELSQQQIATATGAIFDQASLLAELPLRGLTMDLTGGMDTRAVLAVALKIGLIDKVTAVRCFGPPGLPEFAVAQQLSDTLGLPYESVASAPAQRTQQTQTDGYWRRLRYNAAALDGTIAVHTGMASPAANSVPNLCGTGGELYRPHIHSRRHTTITTEAELRALVARYHGKMDPLTVHRKGMNRRLRSKMRHFASAYTKEGVPYDDVHYLLYAEHRLPWWAGYALSNVMGRRRLYPLVSYRAASVMFSTSPEQKKIDRLHFELMKAADPRLIAIPFFKNHWDERLSPYADGLPMALAEARTSGSAVSVDSWIDDLVSKDWEALFDYVLSAKDSVVFDFVDRDKLESQRLRKAEILARRRASIAALLALVSYRMVETDDVLEAKQGPEAKQQIFTNLEGADRAIALGANIAADG